MVSTYTLLGVISIILAKNKDGTFPKASETINRLKVSRYRDTIRIVARTRMCTIHRRIRSIVKRV